MKNSHYFLLLLLLISTVGCASKKKVKVDTPAPPVAEAKSPEKESQFAKITKGRLELVLPVQRQYVAGREAVITIAIRNTGRYLISLPEWHLNEEDNIRLYCQPWLPNMSDPDPNMWLPVDNPIQEPIKRFEIKLYPDNQATVHKPLDFIKDLVVSSDHERRFFMKAELNLTSYQLVSDVFAISVVSK